MTAVRGVVSEEGADRKMPPGVLVEGPVVDAKFLDSYIAFGLMIGGSIAALVWAFTQGIGWEEISVFVGMWRARVAEFYSKYMATAAAGEAKQ